MSAAITSRDSQSKGTLASVSQSQNPLAPSSSSPVEKILEEFTFQLKSGCKVRIALLDDSPLLKESVKRIGEEQLILNHDLKQVSFRGKPVTLTKRRFKVFAYLFKHHPRPVTLAALANGAWEKAVADGTPRDEIHRMRSYLDQIGILLPIDHGQTWIDARPIHVAKKLQ